MKKYFYLYLCAVFASFGGLLSGYDTGVISGALLYIDKSFDINSVMMGFLVSSVSFGAVVGALLNGFLIDKIGRKKVLIMTAIVFMAGSVSCYFSSDIIQLIASRITVGIAVGVVSFAGPLYLSEISVKEKRGQIVSFHQITITLGILFSYLSNYFCSNMPSNWRLMLLLGAAPAFILFFGMLFQNDTPRWLVYKNKIEEAEKILKKINPDSDVNLEIKNIQETITQNESFVFTKKLLKPFVIGIGIMFVQIVTGINAIIYYAPVIFKTLGFSSEHDVLLATIFIGIINFLMTFVAFFLVDKLGRKPLLYIGLSGMLFSLVVMAVFFVFDNFYFVKYLAVIFCAVYIVSFSMSLGPIALLLISEIFPLRYRGMAMSSAIVANFVFNFLTTGLFPILMSKLGGFYTFMIFAFICVISLVFVYFIVPETKGISLEEIEKQMKV